MLGAARVWPRLACGGVAGRPCAVSPVGGARVYPASRRSCVPCIGSLVCTLHRVARVYLASGRSCVPCIEALVCALHRGARVCLSLRRSCVPFIEALVCTFHRGARVYLSSRRSCVPCIESLVCTLHRGATRHSCGLQALAEHTDAGDNDVGDRR
jgi:hypothetical protein